MAPRQRLITTPPPPPPPASTESLEDVTTAASASVAAKQQDQQQLSTPLLVSTASSNDADDSISSGSSSSCTGIAINSTLNTNTSTNTSYTNLRSPNASTATITTATCTNPISYADYAAQQAAAADIAREQHDIFNLVALLIVVTTTLSNWNFEKLLQGYGPGEAWTGKHFYLNWATTILYFLVDLIWVSTVPICVKSPDVIVKHHIVAIAYLSAPVAYPEYRWFMGACLSVEINTWFLILRRVIYKRNYWDLIQNIVSICFYVSWIVIRCVIYPIMLVVFIQLAMEKVQTTDRLWHWPMIFIPIHFFLCILNLKWSYDLFEPIVRKWLHGDSSKEGTGSTISSGL